MIPEPPARTNPEDVAVSGISLDYTEISLTLTNPRHQLNATIDPPDATNKAFSWTSMNPAVAKVDSSGLVTAVAPGEAVIMAITQDGVKSATCVVRVTSRENISGFTVIPGNGEFSLYWTNPDSPDFEYVILKVSAAASPASDPPLFEKRINKTDSPNNNYTITGLSNGTTYAVKACAYYRDGSFSGETAKSQSPAPPVTELRLDTLLAVPVKGGTADSSPVTNLAEFASVERSWKNGDGSPLTGAFEEGKVYKAVLVITAKPGYTFAGAGSFTHGGASDLSVLVSADYRAATITVSFPAVERESGSGSANSGDPEDPDDPSAPAAVTGISLDYTAIDLTLTNPTRQLTPVISPANAADKTVTWSSMNPVVARVNSSGLVTALSPGTAVIMAVTQDGGRTAACTVNITDSNRSNVTGFALVPGNNKLDMSWVNPPAADFEYVMIRANPANGSLAVPQRVDKPDQSYTAQGLTNGTPYEISISAHYSDGTQSGETTLSPVAPSSTVGVTGISLDLTELALTMTSPTGQLTPVITPPNATNMTVTWASMNPGVAKVNGSGLVTALTPGTAVIMVITQDGGKTASCLVTVSASGLANVTGFTAVPGNTEIGLNWTNPTAAEFESVVISAVPTAGSLSSAKTINKTDSPNNSYTVTGLDNGTSYTIKIKAHYSGGGNSGETTANVIPAATVTDILLDSLISAPVTAASPNTAPTTAHNQFTSVARAWKKGDDSPHTGSFQAGQVYKAVLTITVKQAYTFAGVSGFSYTAASSVTHMFTGDYKTATVTITFPPTLGVTVSGKITGGGGDLEGAAVQLKKDGTADYLSPAATGTDGTYTISGVAAGTYTIAVSKPGYSSAVISSFTVTTVNVTGRNATLNRTVTALDLSGLVDIPLPATAPDTSVTLPGGAAGQYTSGSVTWQRTTGTGTVSTFEPGTAYKVTFTLNAASGWSFSGLVSGDFSFSGASRVSAAITNGSSAALTLEFPTVQWTEVNTNTASGSTSLIENLNWIKANGRPGENYTVTVVLDETIPTQILNVGDSPYKLINVNITIQGDTPTRTVRLSGTGPLFDLIGAGPTQKITLTLKDITLQGVSGNNAPLVRATTSANLVMEAGSKITGNSYSYGGGVSVSGGNFTMTGGEISGNSSYNGGGVCLASSSFTMEGGKISGNSSSYGGGGVYLSSSSFTMKGGELSGNSSSNGGGVYLASSSSTMEGGEMIANSSTASGGGVYFSATGGSPSFTMSGTVIKGNTAKTTGSGNAMGGGVYFSSSNTSVSFTMSGGTVEGNTAETTGSGSAMGGGVYFSPSSSFTMSGTVIKGNTAKTTGSGSAAGGGIYLSSSFSSLTMESGEISGNYVNSSAAGSGGGGVYANGTLRKTGGLITGDGNTAHTPGDSENTASNGSGHAVLLSKGWKRNSDAGAGVNMDSGLAGPSGGWE
jgi:uncharacterized protein YjdB